MKSLLSLSVFIGLSLCQIGLTAKILVFHPIVCQSHVNWMDALINIIIEEGHDVTVIAFMGNRRINFNDKRRFKLIRIPASEEFHQITQVMENDPGAWTSNTDSAISTLFSDKSIIRKVMYMICQQTINHTGLFEQLREESFDLGLSEVYNECGPGFQTSASDEELVDSLALRLKNVAMTWDARRFFDYFVEGAQNALDERFPGESPSLDDLRVRSDVVFTNPLLDYPRPTLAKIVEVAGITVPPHRNLSEDFAHLLRLRPKNVLIAFGSLVRSIDMPVAFKVSVVELARRFPNVTFLWKYEKPDDMVGIGLENLVKLKWMPQTDLLSSGRIDAFITHSGMGSTVETAMNEVPAIVIGIRYDQLRNARMLSRHGSAIVFDKHRLGDSLLFGDTVGKILNEPSYKFNAKRLAHILKSGPFSQRKLFTRYIDFVATNGHLLPNTTPVSTRLSFVQLWFLDGLALFVLSLIAIPIVATKASRSLQSFLHQRAKLAKLE